MAHKKKKERILVVEDDAANAIAAVMAMPKDVELKIASDYEGFQRMVEDFKPDLVLSDAEIKASKEDRRIRDYRKEISDVLDKKKIPYLFVTRAPTGRGHEEKVYIIEKEAGEYKELKSFDTIEKNPTIWKEAYEKLKKKALGQN